MPAANDLAVSFIDRANGSSDAKSVVEDYARTVAAFGFSSFIMTGLPRSGEDVETLIVAERWPEGWRDVYREQNCFQCDPVAVASAKCAVPFTWAEARLWYTSSAKQAQIAHTASEYGLKDGVGFPLFATGAQLGVVSLGAQDGVELTPADVGMVYLASLWCHLRITELRRPSSAPGRKHLTSRECEILKWMAQGKSAWEAGQILTVSEATVNTHLRNIRQKLGATNTTHAVAQALVTGQIAL